MQRCFWTDQSGGGTMVQGFVDLVCSVSEPVGCLAAVVLWWFFVHRWISFIQYLLEGQWSVYVNLSLLNSYGGSALISMCRMYGTTASLRALDFTYLIPSGNIFVHEGLWFLLSVTLHHGNEHSQGINSLWLYRWSCRYWWLLWFTTSLVCFRLNMYYCLLESN